jgi:CMP-N,N'-diacetyllegionaminic acid synthase
MFKKKTVLAIVIARGGSKGIKLKNLRKINNQTLIWHVGKIIKKIKYLDKAIISTDHYRIANEALKAGIKAPFIRPKKIAGDNIRDVDVLKHALSKIEKLDKKKYDIILMLQPTSPIRTTSQIIDCLKILIKNSADSVWTVSKTDTKFHPDKQLLIKSKKLNFFSKRGNKIKARQELSETYYKNGVCYAVTRKCLLEKNSIKGDKCLPLIINKKTVNIDTLEDLRLARSYLK